MLNYEAIREQLAQVDVSGLSGQVEGIDPQTAAKIAADSKSSFEKALGVAQELSDNSFKFQAFMANTILNAVFDTFENIAPPLFQKLGRLGIIKDLEYQKGLESLEPTPIDVVSAIKLMYLHPEQRTAYTADLAKQGYSAERIANLMEAGRNLLSEDDLKNAAFRDLVGSDEIIKGLQALGYSNDDIPAKVGTWQSLLGVGEIRDLFLRGELTKEDAAVKLAAIGFDSDDILSINKLFWFIPPQQDLITMAVREVFSPEIAERFGQFAEFPSEFEKYASQQGISPEWAKRYWAAHWDLPSVQMGFEMLHRGVIGDDDLGLLMKAKDIMPFWRDKLTAISYRPLTRVDVRRMYDLGVMDRDGVYRSYKDIGYSDENAELMTNFTEVYTLEHERDLTKSEIVKAYENRMTSYEVAEAMLGDLGYQADDAGVILALADYRRDSKLRTIAIRGIKAKFKAGLIDVNGAYDALNGLNLDAEETELIVDEVKTAVFAKATELSKEDLAKALKLGVIQIDVFRSKLVNLGYQAEDIDILAAISS